ncbi:hypothetical protein POSPLADRAFT_1047159 [Postia placenta MAD-698-R-SB12]|uniref:Uncharacterized protein n=1 Tax=Postia placenta MAD-698-R-SB12 TaxID=670580 RepID=A0A1X6MWQ8_9APHY|nr:hypothetical protein POSPLADRAFT_1047159 [Postia placenta MAD-698-R-SB12]OSX60791.1 hypothetical protein POSPLADRAFT_1047159 [Postia placenta MAD-698-R-SB12]
MPTYIVRPCLGIISIQENRAYSAADEWALLIGRDLSLGSCHGAAVSTPIAFAVVSVEPGVVAGANATKRRQAHRHVIKSYCRDNVGEDGVSACVDEGCDAKKEHWTQHISTILAVAVAERFSDQCARHSIRGLGPCDTVLVATTSAGRFDIDQDSGLGDGRALVCIAVRIAIGRTCFCTRHRGTTWSLDMVLGGTYLDLRADKQAFGAVLLRERPGFLDVDFRTTAPGTSVRRPLVIAFKVKGQVTGARDVDEVQANTRAAMVALRGRTIELRSPVFRATSDPWVIGLRTHRRLLAFTHAITFLEAADREAGVNWTCASQLLPLCKRTDGHSTYEEHHTVYSDHTPRGRRDGLQGPPLGRGCMARGSPRDPAACARLPVGKHGLALEASDSLISLGGGESLVEQLAVTIEERTPLAAARTITTTNTSASASMPSGAYTERASILRSVAPIHFDDASRLVSPPPWAAGRAPGFRSQINRTPGIWGGRCGPCGALRQEQASSRADLQRTTHGVERAIALRHSRGSSFYVNYQGGGFASARRRERQGSLPSWGWVPELACWILTKALEVRATITMMVYARTDGSWFPAGSRDIELSVAYRGPTSEGNRPRTDYFAYQIVGCQVGSLEERRDQNGVTRKLQTRTNSCGSNFEGLRIWARARREEAKDLGESERAWHRADWVHKPGIRAALLPSTARPLLIRLASPTLKFPLVIPTERAVPSMAPLASYSGAPPMYSMSGYFGGSQAAPADPAYPAADSQYTSSSRTHSHWQPSFPASYSPFPSVGSLSSYSSSSTPAMPYSSDYDSAHHHPALAHSPTAPAYTRVPDPVPDPVPAHVHVPEPSFGRGYWSSALYIVNPGSPVHPPPTPAILAPLLRVKSEEDSDGGFIFELPPAGCPSAGPGTMPEVPLRATHACKAMRALMSSFRLDPFAMHNGIRSAAVTAAPTGIEVGPLRHEPLLFEWQAHLDAPLLPPSPSWSTRSLSPMRYSLNDEIEEKWVPRGVATAVYEPFEQDAADDAEDAALEPLMAAAQSLTWGTSYAQPEQHMTGYPAQPLSIFRAPQAQPAQSHPHSNVLEADAHSHYAQQQHQNQPHHTGAGRNALHAERDYRSAMPIQAPAPQHPRYTQEYGEYAGGAHGIAPGTPWTRRPHDSHRHAATPALSPARTTFGDGTELAQLARCATGSRLMRAGPGRGGCGETQTGCVGFRGMHENGEYRFVGRHIVNATMWTDFQYAPAVRRGCRIEAITNSLLHYVLVIQRIVHRGQPGGAVSAPCVAPSDDGVQAMLFANRVLPRSGHAVMKFQICLMGSLPFDGHIETPHKPTSTAGAILANAIRAQPRRQYLTLLVAGIDVIMDAGMLKAPPPRTWSSEPTRPCCRGGRLAITVAQQACALAGRGMGMCTSNKLRAHRGVSIVTAPQGGAGWTNYAASPMRSCASADAYRKRMSPSRRVYSERPHTLQPGCSAWMLPADLASSTSTARPEEPKARARAPLRAQGPLRLVPARQSARGRAGAECTPLNLANRSSTLLLPHAGVRVVRLTMRWARALEPADIEYEWGMICFAILRMHSAPHTLRDRIRAGTSSPCVILAEITAKHETLYGLCPPAKHAKKGGARKPQEREGTTQRAAAKATILSAQRHPFSILFTVQRVGGSAGMWTDPCLVAASATAEFAVTRSGQFADANRTLKRTHYVGPCRLAKERRPEASRHHQVVNK